MVFHLVKTLKLCLQKHLFKAAASVAEQISYTSEESSTYGLSIVSREYYILNVAYYYELQKSSPIVNIVTFLIHV